MREMILRYMRQKFGNVGILLALAAIALLSMISLASGRPGGAEGLALLVLAAASVSKDISSGALQMILARPIHRSRYLFGRYLGILTAYAIFLLAALLLAILLPKLFSLVFGEGGPEASISSMARAAGASWLHGTLAAAILLFFSTFLPGLADVLAYILLKFSLGVTESLAAYFPRVAKAGRIAHENLMAEVSWGDILHGRGIFGAPTGRFVLALTVFLIAAAFVFSRREFSYGQD